MNAEKIGYIEAVSLIILVIINKIILILPKEILYSTGSSAWLNTLYATILIVLLAWFISFLFKKFQGHDIIDVSGFLGGTVLKNVVCILYILLLLVIPIFVLKNFTEALKIIYFKTSPLLYLLLFFLISSMIANHFSLKVLAKANLFLMTLSFLGIVVILVSSAKNFSFDRLFPILGYGFKETFISGTSTLFSFSGIGYLFLLNPLLDKPEQFKKISIFSMAFSGIYLFLTVTCILLSLSFTFTSGESISLYILTRILEYGRFIQRIDALFILLWIISIILYISFAIHFALYLFKRLTKINDSKYINYTFHLFILAILLIPVGIANFNNIVENIFKIGTFVILFGISILILILANLKLKIINKRKGIV